jgi:hypothetical protein
MPRPAFRVAWAADFTHPDGPRSADVGLPAAGLGDHLWSLREWVSFPACQRL